MTAKTRREREREQMRAKILDAARALFLEEGYESVSMRKVADRIEYTPTTLYNHFEDKESLVRAICEVDFLALRESFEAVAGIADPVERLRVLGSTYVGFALSHPGSYRFLFMTMHAPKALDLPAIERGNPDQDAYAFLLATVAEGIAAGRYREEFADADGLAQMIWSGVHGVVALYLIKGADPWINWRPVAEIAASAIEATIRGIVRDAPGGSEAVG